MSGSVSAKQNQREYPTSELVRRLLALAWQFRGDCLLSLALSLALLLLGLAGLQLLLSAGVARHARQEGVRQRLEFPRLEGAFSPDTPLFVPLGPAHSGARPPR